MAAIDYSGCEQRLKAHEGSEYTDGVHPYDPGGPTRWGITLTDARLYWHPNASAADVQAMPWSVAQDIYRGKYWARQDCDDLPAGIDDCVFDYGVNSGVARSGKVLRRVLGLSDADWHTSDAVIVAVRQRDPDQVIDAICGERLQFLRGLRIWPTYAHGWTIRVNEVRNYAHQLAANVRAATPAGAAKPPPPMPQVTQIPSDGMGKGAVAPPVVAKKIIVQGGGAAVAASGGFVHWIGAHPFETGLMVASGLAAIGLGVAALNAHHAAKQEAPTLGLVPVPVRT